MNNRELTLAILETDGVPVEVRKLLDEHRPERVAPLEDVEAIANIHVDISDHSNPFAYAARRVYNAEYGYHHLLAKNQALGACLDEIQANSERTVALIEAGRAGR